MWRPCNTSKALVNRVKHNILDIREKVLKMYYQEIIAPNLRKAFTDDDFNKCSKMYLVGGGALYPEIVQCFKEEFGEFVSVEVYTVYRNASLQERYIYLVFRFQVQVEVFSQFICQQVYRMAQTVGTDGWTVDDTVVSVEVYPEPEKCASHGYCLNSKIKSGTTKTSIPNNVEADEIKIFRNPQLAVGIDIGNANTCVTIYKDGE